MSIFDFFFIPKINDKKEKYYKKNTKMIAKIKCLHYRNDLNLLISMHFHHKVMNLCKL